MKVTVYQGENFVQTNEYVLQLAAQPQGLQPVFVLVPDRFTLQAEKLMLKAHAKLLNTRIVTFSMLYQIVTEDLHQGAPVNPIIDKTTAVLHLWTAIKQVQGELQWFKKSVNHYDFAEKLYNTINQMRSSCVDFTTLSGQVSAVVAQKKYHDINLIYQKYCAIIAGQTDSSGMLEYLAANLANSSVIKNATFYVCGFESLSPARLQVLQQICRHAKSVTIAASQKELLSQINTYPVQKIQAPLAQPVTHTARCLTPRQEAEVVARKIIQLLNDGVAPEAITVLLTEFETLAPVWEVVWQQLQIPVNIDVGQKLSATAEARYLRDLLELAMNDNAENTLAVMYNTCSGMDETIFDLENRILKSNLRAAYVPEVKKLSQTKNKVALCQELSALTTQTKLQDILTKLAQYSGLQELSLREFTNLFWTLCTATKLSNIPIYANRILIAPVSEWVPTRVQHLFIANCTADNFPKGQPDNDLLQEADLAGTKITPTPKLQRQRNFNHANLLKTVPDAALYFSGTCEEFLPAAYRSQTHFKIHDDQSPVTVGAALFLPQSKIKTTMVEKFYTCPHLNFLENGLRLRPREIYQLKPNLVGLAIHEALEVYFRDQNLAAALRAGVAKLNYDCPPIVAALKKEIRFIINQLETAFANGQFKIAALEKNITKKLPNGYNLVGRIDRVDVATAADGHQVACVLDYKTGSVPSAVAKSIYLGNKLQLPLYAAALAKPDQIAGAGYLALPGGYTEESKTIKIKGFINEKYRDLFAAELLNPREQQYLTTANIAAICDYANQMVTQAVARLTAGEVKAQPISANVCETCPARLFCQSAGENCRGDGVKFSFEDFMGGQS